MKRKNPPSPPLARSVAALAFVFLFLVCFLNFLGGGWPDWAFPRSFFGEVEVPAPDPGEGGIPEDGVYPESGVDPKLMADPSIRWVVVDAGHGGLDGGTQGNGMLEKKYVLDISQHLKARLKELGIPVLMTRETDKRVSLADRSKLANSVNCAAFVSIHLNYSSTPAVSGVETFYSSPKTAGSEVSARKKLNIPQPVKFGDGRSKLLAQAIQDKICSSTGANDRGIKNKRFQVTLNTHAPAVLVECGFLSHVGEATRVKKEAYRKQIAESVASGLIEFLNETKSDRLYGITFKDPKHDPQKNGSAAALATIPGE